jgi:hypothetical protein
MIFVIRSAAIIKPQLKSNGTKGNIILPGKKHQCTIREVAVHNWLVETGLCRFPKCAGKGELI